MNEYYTFTGTLINGHLGQHNQNRTPVIQQPYCGYCYPPPKEYSWAFYRFITWTATHGAVSYNRLTYQFFEELTESDRNEVHPNRIRQRIVRLLNTLLFEEPFFIEDQTRLVVNTLNAFRDTRNFERTTPDINIEEVENNSDDYYSETRHSEENEEILINNNNLEEQRNPSPHYQIRTPTPEPEEEMANVDAVLNAVNQLTNALTAQNN